MLKNIFLKQQNPEKLKVYVKWVVKWESRNGEYSCDTKKEFEIFTNREDAEIFKQRLIDSFEFIKHTSGDKVEMYEN